MKNLLFTAIVVLVAINLYAQDLKPVKVTTMEGIFYGYENSSGVRVIPAKYTVAKEFVNGFAVVQNSTKLYAYIDSTGNEITEYKYSKAENFINGFAEVSIGYNKDGFINEQGKEICPLEYTIVHDFQNGFAVVEKPFGEGYQRGLKKGVINSEGKLIIPCENYEITVLINCIIVIPKIDYKDLYNFDGKIIIEKAKYLKPVFEGAEYFSYIENGKYAIKDINGTQIYKPLFYKISSFQYNDNQYGRLYFDSETFFYIDKEMKCVEFEDVVCPE